MLIQINYDIAIAQVEKRRIVIRGKDSVFEILDANRVDIFNNRNEIFYLDLKSKDKESLIKIVNKRNIIALIASILFVTAFYQGIQYYYHGKYLYNLIFFTITASSSVGLFIRAMDSQEINKFIKELD